MFLDVTKKMTEVLTRKLGEGEPVGKTCDQKIYWLTQLQGRRYEMDFAMGSFYLWV